MNKCIDFILQPSLPIKRIRFADDVGDGWLLLFSGVACKNSKLPLALWFARFTILFVHTSLFVAQETNAFSRLVFSNDNTFV